VQTNINKQPRTELIRENRRITVEEVAGRLNVVLVLPVILMFSRIISRVLSSFRVVVAAAGRPERSVSVTLVRPFSNISIHSWTILRERTLSPYWAHMRKWICAPGTPSAHKKRMTERCSSLVQFISFAAIFTQRDNSHTKLQGQPACPTD